MGWVWVDDDEPSKDSTNSSSADVTVHFGNPISDDGGGGGGGDHCSTSKIYQTKCNTVEVEPGKFVRKCEKTEQILRDCAGKPTEIVKSNKEYTEEDVTNDMKKGSFFLGSPGKSHFDMPGLRSDLEAMERSVFGSMNRLFEAASEIGNGFFRIMDEPSLFGGESSSSSKRRGVHVEGPVLEEPKTNSIDSDSGSIDLSGLTRDV